MSPKFKVGDSVWFEYQFRSIINGEVAAVFEIGGKFYYNVRANAMIYSNIGEKRMGPRQVGTAVFPFRRS